MARFTFKLVPVLFAFVFVTKAEAQTKEVRPNLYVLTIGVGDFAKVAQYPDLKKGVSGAPNDANDIADEFVQQRGKLYQRVEVIKLTNALATRENILKSLASLKSVVRPGDTVVVFVAGHGGLYQNQYIFSTYEFDPADWSTGLSWSAFMDVLGGLPGTRMLILDTCHSGAAVGNGVAITAGQDLLQDGARVGVVVYAACTSRQSSLQFNSDRNGVFTKALLEALRGRADLNGDGLVTMAEMDAYVDNRVRAATNGRQHPTMQRPASISSSYTMVSLHGTSQAAPMTHLVPTSDTNVVTLAGNLQPVNVVNAVRPHANQARPR